MHYWLALLALSGFLQEDAALSEHAGSAAVAMKKGDYTAAERENRAVLKLRPQMAEAEMNLGLACFLQKKYADALHAFETVRKLRPDMDAAVLFLGISQFKLNHFASALPDLKTYTAGHPDDFE